MQNIEEVAKFYGEMYAKYGGTAKGMGYVSDESHRTRLSLVPKVVQLGIGAPAMLSATWLDVGCGVGMLRDHLYGNTYRTYTGIDAVADYINEAHREKDVDQELWYGDFLDFPLDDTPLNTTYTITSAIGTLAWQPATTALDILNRMWKLTTRAMIFTALINRPFPLLQLTNLEKEMVGAKGSIILRGYAPTNEAMICLLKG